MFVLLNDTHKRFMLHIGGRLNVKKTWDATVDDLTDQNESMEEAIKARRTGFVIIFLVSGIGLLVLNALLPHLSKGIFSYLVPVGPVFIVMAAYFLLFSEDQWDLHWPIPLRLILFLILAFGLAIANMWATENGWYSVIFKSG